MGTSACPLSSGTLPRLRRRPALICRPTLPSIWPCLRTAGVTPTMQSAPCSPGQLGASALRRKQWNPATGMRPPGLPTVHPNSLSESAATWRMKHHILLIVYPSMRHDHHMFDRPRASVSQTARQYLNRVNRLQYMRHSVPTIYLHVRECWLYLLIKWACGLGILSVCFQG